MGVEEIGTKRYIFPGEKAQETELFFEALNDIDARIKDIGDVNVLAARAIQDQLRALHVAEIPKRFTNLIPLIRFSKPILSPSPTGGWDDVDVHSHTIFRDRDGKYWLYYNGRQAATSGIGLAESTDGINFTKHPNNPLLSPVPGTWESKLWKMHVLKIADNDFRMWYGGVDADEKGRIGYATSPDGITWTKYAENPILELGAPGECDETYVADLRITYDRYKQNFAGVFAAGAYTTREIGSIGYATSPDGITWTKYAGNPVMRPSPKSWTGDGISPKSLTKNGNIYVLLYEGREGSYCQWRFGIAYSYDLINWFEDFHNPILSWGIPRSFDDYYVADPVIIYEAEGWGRCYYGAYSSVADPEGRQGYIGLVYFAFETPIRLSYNILTLNSLAGGAASALADCLTVFLYHAKSIELTAEETYHASATAGGRLYLYSSADGQNWDTKPIETRTLAFTAGNTRRETFTPGDAVQGARFIKVTIENLDATYTMTDVKVTATLGA